MGEAEIIQKATGGNDTVAHVYFQPPANVELKYPCIVYSQEAIERVSADNKAYIKRHPYKVTYISTRPDSKVPDKILDYPLSRMNATFISEGLYHYVYKLYI